MNILIIGNRAIQHLLAVRLEAEDCNVFVYPGQKCGVYKCISKEDLNSEKFDLIIMGSARYFDDECVLSLINKGVPYFGPDKNASVLETSKNSFKEFANEFMIPTPHSYLFYDYKEAVDHIKKTKAPYVIKANGPARGCGVSILNNIDDALIDLKRKLIDVDDVYYCGSVIIEEFIDGFEVAVNVLIDENGYLVLPPTRPHKRLKEGDLGAIVAGMGTYSPVMLNKAFYQELHDKVMSRTLKGLKSRRFNFKGCLFINLIVSNSEITVLEFNCRMGDPAMLSNILLYENKLIDLIQSTVNNELYKHSIIVKNKISMAVTLIDPVYPEKGNSISQLEIKKSRLYKYGYSSGLCIAGLSLIEKEYFTNNGVLLSSIAVGESFDEVKKLVYQEVQQFGNLYYRDDIGIHVQPPINYSADEGNSCFTSLYKPVFERKG